MGSSRAGIGPALVPLEARTELGLRWGKSGASCAALPFSRGRVGELRPRLTGSPVGGEQGVAGEAAHSQSETASANLSSCFELLSWRVNMLLLCTEPQDSVGKEGLLFEKH